MKLDHRIYFSGSKGFAVYIDFEKTQIEEYRKKLDVFLDILINEHGLESLDKGVCVDLNRISRLPYSINSKSGRFCHPISSSLHLSVNDLVIIHNIIPIFRHANNDYFPAYLNKLQIPKREVTFEKPNSDYLTEVNYILRESRNLIEGVRHHVVRLKIIPTLVMLGYPDQAIIDMCHEYYWNVFDKFDNTDIRWVNNTIQSVRRKKLRPILMSNLKRNYGINGSIGI